MASIRFKTWGLGLACAALVVAACRRGKSQKPLEVSASATNAPVASAPAVSAAASSVSVPVDTPPPQNPTEPWIVPKLPKARLAWHLISQSDSSFDLDRLENAAVVRPWTFDGVSPDVLILNDGKAELVTGFFRGVEIGGGRTARPLEGAWPEPLTLTVATTGRNREGHVLWRQQDRFSPLPGELASHLWFFLLPPRNGVRQFLTKDKDTYPVFEFPAGTPANVHIEPEVDGKQFRVEGAAVQGEQLLVAGVVVHVDPLEPPRGGGGPPGGPIVVQRFAGAASKPVLDRMPTLASTARAMSGMVTAGNNVFIALHGSGNHFAWYDGKSWHAERMPIDLSCNGTYVLTGAKDGSVFVAPYCATEGVDAYRRDPSGNYSTIAFPSDVENCDFYAESSDKVWLACGLKDGNGGKLFFTQPLQDPRTLRSAGTKD